MRLILRERTRSEGSALPRSFEPSSGESATVEHELEVPPRTVAGFITKLGGFTAVVTTLTTFLTFWLSDVPKRHDQARSAQLEILQRALQVDDPDQRLASVHLLLKMGLLKNENGLVAYINSLKTVPHWKPTAASSLTSDTDRTASVQQPGNAKVDTLANKTGAEPPPLPRPK